MFYDERFIIEKLETILKVLKRNNESDDVEHILRVQNYNIHKEPRLVIEWMKILEDVKNKDIREGTVFGSIYNGIWGWQWDFLKRYSSQDETRAKRFVCSKIPKLDSLFEKRLGLYTPNRSSEDNLRLHERWTILPFDLPF